MLVTTWPLLAAPIAPGVFVVPKSVAVAVVLLYQGVPFMVLWSALEAARRHSDARYRQLRSVTLIGAATLLLSRFGGAILSNALTAIDLTVATRSLVVSAYVIVIATLVWVGWRHRSGITNLATPLVESIGVGALVVPLFLMSLIDSSGDQTVRYAPHFVPQGTDAAAIERPVFVLVFDELSAAALVTANGQIDGERFPNFAELATRGIVFEEARASYFNTHYALPSLAEGLAELGPLNSYIQFREADLAIEEACGRQIECRGIGSLTADEPSTIFKHIAISTAANFVPPPWNLVTDAPLSALSDSLGTPLSIVDPDGLHLFTEQHLERFVADISTEDAGGGMYLFHTLASHYPHVRNASGGVRSTPVTRGRDGRLAETAFRIAPPAAAIGGKANLGPLFDAYLDQIAYADGLLGEVFDRMREAGLYDQSIIIVTADHGVRREAFDSPPAELDDWVTRIPLIVAAPGLPPGVVSEPVQSTDLPRMISLLSRPNGDVSLQALSHTDDRPRWFVINGEWVYHPSDDGVWRLAAELEPTTLIARTDVDCFAYPGTCARVLVRSEEAPESGARPDQ